MFVSLVQREAAGQGRMWYRGGLETRQGWGDAEACGTGRCVSCFVGPGVGMWQGCFVLVSEVNSAQCHSPQQCLPSVCCGNEGVGLLGNTKTLIVFLIKVGWCEQYLSCIRFFFLCSP